MLYERRRETHFDSFLYRCASLSLSRNPQYIGISYYVKISKNFNITHIKILTIPPLLGTISAVSVIRGEYVDIPWSCATTLLEGFALSWLTWNSQALIWVMIDGRLRYLHVPVTCSTPPQAKRSFGRNFLVLEHVYPSSQSLCILLRFCTSHQGVSVYPPPLLDTICPAGPFCLGVLHLFCIPPPC